MNRIPLNHIKSDGCCVQSYKAVFYELWFLMVLALSMHVQLELLCRSQTWVKSKLKSFQIPRSACLSPSKVPDGLDLDSFWTVLRCQTGSINHREVFFIRVLSATLTLDWWCGQRRTSACRPAPSFYTFCHKAPLLAISGLMVCDSKAC